MVRLRPRLEEAELQWPRLGYLTRREKLKAISCRGDPLAIIPLIGRVFPSITTLHYVETSFSSDRDSGQGEQPPHVSETVMCVGHRLSSDWSGGKTEGTPTTGPPSASGEETSSGVAGGSRESHQVLPREQAL